MEKKLAALGAVAGVIGAVMAVFALVRSSAVTTTNMRRDINQIKEASSQNKTAIAGLDQYLAELPPGTILAWDQVIRSVDGKPTGESRQLPRGWAVCDGTNHTPDLTDRFLRGSLTSGTRGGLDGGNTGTVDTENGIDLNKHKHQTTEINWSNTGVSAYGAPFGEGDAAEEGTSIHMWTKNGGLADKGRWKWKLTDTPHRMNLNDHVHSIQTVPAFYSVVFIMKVK